MSHQQTFIKTVIAEHPSDKEGLLLLLRRHVKDAKEALPKFSSLLRAYRELLSTGEITEQPWLEQLLVKRAIRTLSGVAPVHVMTAPLGCPANCLYCPNEPGMPKSYLSSQPGAMRAILNDFDPYKQVLMRLRALYQNGHHPEKIEIVENGGTWTALPRRYRTWFMTRCFQAANDFDPKDYQETTDFIPHHNSRLHILNRLNSQPDHLQKEELRLQGDDDQDLLEVLFATQKKNETSAYRIIGVTLETRPDWLADSEILHLRQMGCTKLEIGVQSINEEVLKWNNRGHGVQAVIDATQRLRDAGFKVAYHMMPGMFKATPENDIEMFVELFKNPAFKPDFLKVYPCVVVQEAALYKLWEKGEYIPYDGQTLIDILIEIIKTFPRYCRVARLIRDIPSESISGGNKITNLREMVEQQMAKKELYSQDIRAREVMGAVEVEDLTLNDQEYETTGGKEHFLSFDGNKSDKLYAFLRLRLPEGNTPLINDTLPELKDAALIREVHTYGKLARLSGNDEEGKEDRAQHKGLGIQLMAKAEELAKESGFKKMAVIAGIGTREYYRKFGYELEGTYMLKGL